MSPETIPITPEPCVEEDEAPALDEVIEQIDQSLPAILQKAAPLPGKKRPVKMRITKRAQSVFLAMSKDPLLTESGDDIRVTPKNGTCPD